MITNHRRIKSLELRIETLEKEVYFLSNPPKFKRGDKVSWCSDTVYTVLDKFEYSKLRFLSSDLEYVREYEIIDCKTLTISRVEEQYLSLVNKKRKK